MSKSKNNPANRSKDDVIKKMHDGKPVKPFLYIGTNIGHGKYIAAQYENGQVIADAAGKPLAWDAV